MFYVVSELLGCKFLNIFEILTNLLDSFWQLVFEFPYYCLSGKSSKNPSHVNSQNSQNL